MNFIKQQRKKLGYTQASLAEQTGLSLRTIQRLESSIKAPKGHTLEQLSKVLEVEPMELRNKFQGNHDTVDQERLSIQYINLSTLSFIGIPFGNIFLPYLVWKNRRTSPKVDEVAKRIINFQILWTLIFCLSLIIAPFLNAALSLPVNLILYVLGIGMLSNLIVILFIAYRIQQNRTDFLNLPLRLL